MRPRLELDYAGNFLSWQEPRCVRVTLKPLNGLEER